MKLKKIFFYLKLFLNFRNLKTSALIGFYNLIKKNTKYPNYLIKFEKKLSNFFDCEFATSFSNGTTACSMLLYAIGVKKNSKVIISKLTFPSVITSILKIGAKPIFVDFNKDLQIEIFERDLIINADYLLITHAYGIPQNYKSIKNILNINQKLILIEDISHAQGATFEGNKIGTLGLASFMSMQGDKAINAGEGGVVITNSKKINDRLLYLSHLNRKSEYENDYFNSLSKIGFLGKARMNPLGAISAMNDLEILEKKNINFRLKLGIIYENLKDCKNIYFPRIDLDCTGGYHYGFPFFTNSSKIINIIKKSFNIIKYNWPILDSNENFSDPEKFLNLIYDEQIKLDNVFEKSNDLRDELFFFDLQEISQLSVGNLKNKISKLKSVINED